MNGSYFRAFMDLLNKPKLDIDKQIDLLKSRGVKFIIDNERVAKQFLQDNTYFYKIKSYSKNYPINKENKYTNLDFAYLRDLSIIDMHLRKFIIELCLDIEHILRTKLLSDIQNNIKCDGYKIVDDFFEYNTQRYNQIKNQINSALNNKNTRTIRDKILIKYRDNLAVWNLVEIIDFGFLIDLCEFYYKQYKNAVFNKIKGLLWASKCMRNLSAHNNCIIDNLLAFKTFKPNNQINNVFISKYNLILNAKNRLKNPAIHDFISALIVFDILCKSKKMKRYKYKQILDLFSKRMRRNSNYYKTNSLITGSFSFVAKFLIYLYKKNF